MHDWRIEEPEYARQEERRGRRHAFESLVPERTALVVIDMVPFFVADGYCLGIVPNISSNEDSSPQFRKWPYAIFDVTGHH